MSSSSQSSSSLSKSSLSPGYTGTRKEECDSSSFSCESLYALRTQAWDYFYNDVADDIETEYNQRKDHRHRSAVMKLNRLDMGLFGVCPETDDFSAVVCSICNAVVKPPGLKSHMIIRHNYSSRREHNVVSSNVISQSSMPNKISRTAPISSLSSSGSGNSNKRQKTSTQTEQPEEEVSIVRHIPLTPNKSGKQQPQRVHHKKGRNNNTSSASNSNNVNNKLIPIKDRDYTPDVHCGVLTGDPPKPCTRSLTCKSHALSLRRMVSGRTKTFDKLLNDHRTTKSTVSSAGIDIDSESSNSNSSSLNAMLYDEDSTVTTSTVSSTYENEPKQLGLPSLPTLLSLPPPPPPPTSSQSSNASDSTMTYSDSDVDIEGCGDDIEMKLCKDYDEDSKSLSASPTNTTISSVSSYNCGADTSTMRINLCESCHGLKVVSTTFGETSYNLPMWPCGKCIFCSYNTKRGPCCHGILKSQLKNDCGVFGQFVATQCRLACGFEVVIPLCPKTNSKLLEAHLLKQNSDSVLNEAAPIEYQRGDATFSATNWNTLDVLNVGGNAAKKFKIKEENIEDIDMKHILNHLISGNGNTNYTQLIDILEEIRLERERRIRIFQPNKIITKRFPLTHRLKHRGFYPIVLNMMAHLLISKRTDQEMAILSVEIHVDDDNDIYLILSGVDDDSFKDKLLNDIVTVVQAIYTLVKINLFINDNTSLPPGLSPLIFNSYKQIFHNTENITFSDILQTQHVINAEENQPKAVLELFRRIINDRQHHVNANKCTSGATDQNDSMNDIFKDLSEHFTQYNAVSGLDLNDLIVPDGNALPLENMPFAASTEILHQSQLLSQDNSTQLSYFSSDDDYSDVDDEDQNGLLTDNKNLVLPVLFTITSNKTSGLSQSLNNNTRRRDFPGIRKWFRTIPKPITINTYPPLQRSGGGFVISKRLHTFRRAIQNNFSQNNNNIMMNRNQIITSTNSVARNSVGGFGSGGNATTRFYSIGFNRNNSNVFINNSNNNNNKKNKALPTKNIKIDSHSYNSTVTTTAAVAAGGSPRSTSKLRHTMIRKLSNANRLNKYFKKIQ